MFCRCNEIRISMSGGLKAGGSAPVADTIIRGGVICGGSATVDVVQDPYDGLEAIWPLDESGNGTPDEYQDRSCHQFHGTGGLKYPSVTDGVWCQPAQDFQEGNGDGEYITLPPDGIRPNQAFSVSAWLKLETRFKPRVIYSRGFDDVDGSRWVFTLGYGWANHLTATIQTSAKDYTAFSDTTLDRDRWYHVACVFRPSVGLRLYVNGVQSRLWAVPEAATLTLNNGGYVGRHNVGAYRP